MEPKPLPVVIAWDLCNHCARYQNHVSKNLSFRICQEGWMETMADSQKFVEDLFEAALARPPEERSAWLDVACPDSPEVRELVRMLLLADERAGDFLESPFLSPSDISTQEPSSTFELTFEPGATVAGRFHIHRFIARGGMGEVYEAWDSELRERVAIKTIRPDLAQSASIIDRFRREVKQARAISHPNICRIHELYCDTSNAGAKVWFLSMEFLDGFTLSEQIQHVGPLDRTQAFDLLQQLVSGLNALHANGVIHRDLKSGNIMLVSGTPGQLRAVITDFGLATNVLRREGGLLETGGQGTPEFMAPEQIKTADVTALADQYALGVILCEMLTATRPTHKDVTSGRAQFETKLAKAIDPRWSRAILRCLEQNPADRFPTLDEIVLALKPHQPRTRLWLTLAATAALLIALAFWYHFKSAPPATSLAVLPLVNRSGDSNLDYVGAGITEALTDDLSRMPGLQVTAGSIARHHQSGDSNPAAAGSDMHVGSIVTGIVPILQRQAAHPHRAHRGPLRQTTLGPDLPGHHLQSRRHAARDRHRRRLSPQDPARRRNRRPPQAPILHQPRRLRRLSQRPCATRAEKS